MFAKILITAAVAAGVSLGNVAASFAAPAATAIPAPVVERDNLVQVHDRRGFYRHNGAPYYNGHRGYRHRRPGYRQYNGFWFPAFALGLLLTMPQAQAHGLPPAHYRWCEARYKSYHYWDNSWQPYHGPRKPCISPYIR